MRRPNLTKHPKRLASRFYRRLSWHAKLLVPCVVIALGLYLLDWGGWGYSPRSHQRKAGVGLVSRSGLGRWLLLGNELECWVEGNKVNRLAL
jgi:hypothetical protein